MPNTTSRSTRKRFVGVEMSSRVIFSNEGNDRYRYLLKRIWNPRLPMLMFIMAHPSTATHEDDDHTVSVCRNRARKHYDNFGGVNFGGVYVTNLFAFVQRDTKRYEKVIDQVGTENNRIIRQYAKKANITTVCAWGNGGKGSKDNRYLPQAVAIKNMLRRANVTLHHLEPLSNGQPRHPSRFSSAVDFSVWRD